MTKNYIVQKITIAFLLIFSLNGFSQQTKSIELVATDDATIYMNKVSQRNNGKLLTVQLFRKNKKNHQRRFLVKFANAFVGIPSNATITNAVIKLHPGTQKGKGNGAEFPVSVSRLKSPTWMEETVTWGNHGGNFTPESTSLNLPGNKNGDVKKWDVTSDVQKMFAGTYANNGWIFSRTGTQKQTWNFHSSEAAQNLKPKLEITYSVSGDCTEPPSAPSVWKEDKSKNTISLKNSDYNLGIGTPSTGGHKLAVEGSIGAREVKVETKSWADFVFEAGYNLPTLTEVEKHIKEKGHLKDIPSAKEIETNGVLLGEMDAKLLRKIEELTLYTIEREKEIQRLKIDNADIIKKQAEVNSLNKQVEELKKQNSEMMKLFQQLIKSKG